MKTIVTSIENAASDELNEIVQAVIRRYRCLYPDWEVSFFSIPKSNPEERRQALQELIRWLETQMTNGVD